jgi:peroxiredoxin
VSPVEIGQQAPALDVPLDDTQGGEHTLGEWLTSGPLVLGIYKSSCQASKTIFPILQRLYQREHAHGLSVVGVAQDSANITRSFARRYGITFPLLIEPDGYPISSAYDIFATPTVYLIQPDRTVAFTLMGFLRDQVNQFGDVVAAELNQPPQPLITEADTDVPLFVPG